MLQGQICQAKLEKWSNQMYQEPEAAPVEAHMFDLDCLLSDISDTLFTMTQKPSPWASDRHNSESLALWLSAVTLRRASNLFFECSIKWLKVKNEGEQLVGCELHDKIIFVHLLFGCIVCLKRNSQLYSTLFIFYQITVKAHQLSFHATSAPNMSREDRIKYIYMNCICVCLMYNLISSDVKIQTCHI